MSFRARRASAALASVVFAAAGCGGLGGEPPERPPIVDSPDGNSYYLIERGPYHAFYDAHGRLDHIEYDSNGDGRADRIARHDGAKRPYRLEIDADLDGRYDRWEEFDAQGALVRFALLDEDWKPDGRYRPKLWTYVGPAGEHRRYEYDKDTDGRFERTEIVENGRIARVELDTDRDGKVDRWQDWTSGRLATEAIDIDQDGRPDRQLRYGAGGAVTGIERLAPPPRGGAQP